MLLLRVYLRVAEARKLWNPEEGERLPLEAVNGGHW
jgi:hypothetical protein